MDSTRPTVHLRNLFTHPKTAWEPVLFGGNTGWKTLFVWVVPLLLLRSAWAYLFPGVESTATDRWARALLPFLANFGGLLVFQTLLPRLATSLKANLTKSQCRTLLAVTWIPVALADLLARLSGLNAFYLAYFYAAYLLWTGLGTRSLLSSDRRLGFVSLFFLLGFGLIFLFERILAQIGYQFGILL